jgi:hypothetical protein
MSALEALLMQAHALGANFVLREGTRLSVEAPQPLPSALLEALRPHKATIVAALTSRCGWCGSLQLWAVPASGRLYCKNCHAVFNPPKGRWSPGERAKRRSTSHPGVAPTGHR